MLNIDGYQILTQIHESSHSSVYRGCRDSDGQPVILKFLNVDYPTPSEIRRYKQEYEITHHLNLDGVIESYELIPYRRTFIIVFEDFSGISLAQLMHQRRKADIGLLSLQAFLKIATEISEILGRIHAKSIIHKDVNPSNIVANPETGQLKIIDFGLSTIFSRENTTPKSPHILEGTLAYISPEQTGRMNRSLDYRTDFYSLGITFYELLTGQLPFVTTNDLELVHCHIAKQPSPPHYINPSIPKTLSDIVMKLMAKTAEQRYQSAFGITADLAACLHQLDTQGDIADFPIGIQDVSDRFQIPQKIYGRQEEIDILLTAFERVANHQESTAEMMLVAGHAGVGKSSLIAEIHKPNTRLRGYFIEGKFNQFQRCVPYSAIVSAFKGLVQQLLGESEAQLQKWRRELLAAMGNNSQVIIDVIPEIELIVGPQPPANKIGVNEAKSRFDLVFRNFIQVFCHAEHPLIIFLDDLQWADSATLNLIELIMTDVQIKHLFLIGSYRDNEVSKTHVLRMTLDDLEEKKVSINSITLEPLEIKDIHEILVDTLHSDPESVQPLAELIMRKTGGNPFFANQFLMTLYTENLITFNHATPHPSQNKFPEKTWCWDLKKIESQNITDNVIELMVDKLKKLPLSTQKILRLASCIGASFTLDALSVVSEKSEEDVFLDLMTAVQSGFLSPTSDLNEKLLIQDYKFLHDRVQQAAYALIDEAHKKAVHLKIGRLLLANTSPNELPEKIFAIVDHLNIANKLISRKSERIELARLNLEAGRKAKASTAYAAALEKYFTYGTEILSEEDWQKHYDLTFSLYRERSECEYLCGNFDHAETLFDSILKKAKSNIERSEIQNIRLALYDNTGKFLEAIALAAKALKSFGVSLPTAEKSEILSDFNIELEIWKTSLEDIKVSDLLDAPKIENEDIQTCLKLLMNITGPAYFANQDLLALISLKMVNLSIQYGNSDISAYGYALWGFLLGAILSDYEVGYEFGLLAIRLNEKFDNINLNCKVFNTFGGLVNPWRSHIKEGISILRKGYLAGVETGDVFSSYNSYHLIQQRILAADNIDEVIEESSAHFEFLNKTKNHVFAAVQQLYQHFLLSLKGLTLSKFSLSSDEFDELECIHFWGGKHFSPGIAAYNIFKAQVLFLHEDYKSALSQIRDSNNTLVFVTGIPIQAEHYLYYSLILTALYSAASEDEQKGYTEILKANQQKMKLWADNCPENFLHKYLLVEAEIARVSGNDMEALDFYDRAISSAREQGYIQNEALGNELAAKFWLAKRKEEIAQLYLKNAHYAYQCWGAISKVEVLEADYPELARSQASLARTRSMSSSSNSSTGVSLDLSTVIKSTNALSGEIVLEKLLKTLMNILVENAGAERGILMLPRGEKLWIEAIQETGSENVSVLQSLPVDDCSRLSAKIVHYVSRTRESVILDNASERGNFTEDDYIQRYNCQSITCIPLIHRGELQGIIYLENSLTPGAFTQERLDLLQTLATQAAISLENARLYDACSRFVPTQFLGLLDKSSIVDVKLGDQVEREMTVLFADIRDFTRLSEQMIPAENFAFINEYLSYMEPQIKKHNGFVDKYIGDAIMALFPNSADDALRGALAMLEELGKYNQKRKDKALTPLNIGIGLHTGRLMLGTVGGSDRMDGTAIGDAVNISSRVEGLTKIYGTSLLITDQTFMRLCDPLQYDFRFIERVKAKGKANLVSLLEVFSADLPALRDAKNASKALFEEGIILFEQRDFSKAEMVFMECLKYHEDDLASRNYLKRCRFQMA